MYKDLVKKLESKGVKFLIKDNDLKIQAPKGVISPEIQKELALYKSEIIEIINSETTLDLDNQPTKIKLDFSLFFFSNDLTIDPNNKYKLLLESAKFADQNGFSAIWTPERHFNELGGIFPNPAIIASAISTITTNIRLRAGSVVLPLNNPIKIVEDWSVVDNLSNGRVEISVASGWHVNDFVLAPEKYYNRKEFMFSKIETIKKLWRGEEISEKNGAGNYIQIKTFPRPIQKEIPIWVTAIGNIDTYVKAGKIGANLMTCLLEHDIDELKEKLDIYKLTLIKNGFNPIEKSIAVFLHTYLGDDLDKTRDKVYQPFTKYLEGTLDLLGKFGDSSNIDLKPELMKEDEKKVLLDFAFSRYCAEKTLMGTVQSAENILKKLYDAGATEIACLIDFGLNFDDIMQGLEKIKILIDKYK